jgi:hypothetical protein
MPDRGRRPKGGRSKLPTQQPDPPTDHSAGYPKFCLRFLQRGFDVYNLSKEQRADFALTLQQRSTLTWAQLQQARRHEQGFEVLDRAQFRGTVPAVFEDQPRFLVFRYSNRLPMAGVRSADTFHLIWIESEYGELYEHD